VIIDGNESYRTSKSKCNWFVDGLASYVSSIGNVGEPKSIYAYLLETITPMNSSNEQKQDIVGDAQRGIQTSETAMTAQ
jgi:hypothetical protein